MTLTSVDGGDTLWGMGVYSANSNVSGPWLTIYDTSLRPAIRLSITSTWTIAVQHNVSANATPSWTTLVSVTLTAMSYLVFSIKTGSTKAYALYSNGTLIGEGAFTNAAIGPLSYFRAGQTTNLGYISQIVFSRNIPLVGARLNTRKPSGAGSYSQMTGAYSNLVKTALNDTTGVTSDTAGQISTSAYQDVTVPSGMEMHPEVCVWSRVKHNNTEPTSMKQIIISDSVTTKSANLAVDVGIKNIATVFSGMTPTKFNTAEIGQESTTP